MRNGDGVEGLEDGANASVLERIFGMGNSVDAGDVAFGDALKLGRMLFAQMATTHFNPAALASVIDDGTHPLFARRFTAMTEANVRMSWPEQERRVLSRYFTAQRAVADATAAKNAADEKLQDTLVKFEEVRAELALIRLTMTLRGLQEAVRPAVEAGPLVALMFAVLGELSDDDAVVDPSVRAEAKRTVETLTRRISDDAFLEGIGRLIREFAIRYDEAAGAEGKVSLALAERVREDFLRDRSVLERIDAALNEGAALAGQSASGEAASGETSSEGEDEDDVISRLPF